MAVIKQNATFAGTPIDNTHADMIITLEDNPNVRIKQPGGITADSIEYEFIGNVTKDETWTPTVTFLYKEIYKATAQLSLKQIFPVVYVPTSVPIDTTVWASGSQLPFKVMSGENDITANLIDVEFTPTAHVVNYSTVGGTAGNWYIKPTENGTAEELAARTVTYTYKLPLAIDPNQTVRTIECTFNVGAYDGVRTKVTPVTESASIGMGDTTTEGYGFTIWHEGVPNPAELVSVRSDSEYGTVATLANDTKTSNTLRTLNFTAGAIGSETVKLHFGVDDVHSNHAVVDFPVRVYEKGFVRVTSSQDITGNVGDQVEAAVAYELDGVSVANTDITFAADDFITFKTAADGKVTWEITTSNPTEAVVEHTAVVTVTYLAHSDTYNQKVTINPNPSLTWAEGSTFEGEGETAVVLKQQVNDPNA